MKVVLASKNQHKLQEMQTILSQYGLEVVLESDLGLDIEVEETGTTFEENSMLKAQAVQRASGMTAIADDSGLQVDALDGAPGIYSARFGGSRNKTDRDRLEYLLELLKDVPPEKRTARFVSVITMLRPDGSSIVARGICEGVIVRQAQGDGGFGYDPVFFVPQEGCTFAQLPEGRKNEISHRANALRMFVEKLQKEVHHADK